jgi:uncharacterized protein
MSREYLKIIATTQIYVKENSGNTDAGHDWRHAFRVWKMARRLAENEKANNIIVEIAALVHDLVDDKFNENPEKQHEKLIAFFISIDLTSSEIEQIIHIITHISYRHSPQRNIQENIEFQIVQDADRLDAIGAIGIARAFSYGGYKGRPFYSSETELIQKTNDGNTSTMSHFYDKLLLLKDLMNTQLARKIAEERHHYLLLFIQRFSNEVEGIE